MDIASEPRRKTSIANVGSRPVQYGGSTYVMTLLGICTRDCKKEP